MNNFLWLIIKIFLQTKSQILNYTRWSCYRVESSSNRETGIPAVRSFGILEIRYQRWDIRMGRWEIGQRLLKVGNWPKPKSYEYELIDSNYLHFISFEKFHTLGVERRAGAELHKLLEKLNKNIIFDANFYQHSDLFAKGEFLYFL